jgi:hypothetical protein
MVELSKEVKIIFYINIIAGLIYTFQYLIIPDLLYAGESGYNPHNQRVIGGSILALVIGGLIGLKRAELETLKPVWELVIVWFIIVLILDIASLTYMPYTSIQIIRTWIAIIVLIVLLVLNIIAYNRAVK